MRNDGSRMGPVHTVVAVRRRGFGQQCLASPVIYLVHKGLNGLLGRGKVGMPASKRLAGPHESYSALTSR